MSRHNIPPSSSLKSHPQLSNTGSSIPKTISPVTPVYSQPLNAASFSHIPSSSIQLPNSSDQTSSSPYYPTPVSAHSFIHRQTVAGGAFLSPSVVSSGVAKSAKSDLLEPSSSIASSKKGSASSSLSDRLETSSGVTTLNNDLDISSIVNSTAKPSVSLPLSRRTGGNSNLVNLNLPNRPPGAFDHHQLLGVGKNRKTKKTISPSDHYIDTKITSEIEDRAGHISASSNRLDFPSPVPTFPSYQSYDSNHSQFSMVYPPPPPPPGQRYAPGPLVIDTPPPSSRTDDEGGRHGSRRNSIQLPSMTSWAPPPSLPSPRSNHTPQHGSYDPSPSSAGYNGPNPGWATVPPPGTGFPHPHEAYHRHWDLEPRSYDEPAPAPPSPQTGRGKLSSKRTRSKQNQNQVQIPPPLNITKDDEEAGLALAGLGLGLGVQEMKARRASLEMEHAGSNTGANKRIKREDETSQRNAFTRNGDSDKDKDKGKDGRKSCSECRRLKAKCDRQFPCSNCRRRGCALVCPDGDLSCMQGKRLVLASTEELHERIAQLETALFQAHSKAGETGTHPLLAPQFLDGGFAGSKSPPARQAPTAEANANGVKVPSPAPSSPTGALQPTSISMELSHSRSPKDQSSATSFEVTTPLSGEATKVDNSIAGSASANGGKGRMALDLLLNEDAVAAEGKREDEWVGENAAPALIVSAASTATSEDTGDRRLVVERLKKILRVLPPREEAHATATSFWKSSSWYQRILKKDEYDSIYEPAVYAPTPANPLSPHKLACVLMVLTLESYLDITTEIENPSIAQYWDAAQQCFDTRFGWAATVPGVQALALMTLFVGFGWRGARASNFYWLRQMTSAAQQLGLHKDPHPSLPEDEREFRRRVFHELFTIDCLVSLTHGQRTAVPLENIETAYPANLDTLAYTKYEYMRQVKSAVIDIGLRPESAPATNEQIAKVEQNMMRFDATNAPAVHCPALCGRSLPPPTSDPTYLDTVGMTLTSTSMCHYKAMMFLHRPSLRRLISRIRAAALPGGQPITFEDSDRKTIAMTYGACHAVIVSSMYIARTQPRLAARSWFVWVQTFSAAVSIAAIAIWCGPYLEAEFINSAYSELSDACDMIKENGSTRSLGVVSLLPILKSLVANRYPQVIGQDPRSGKVSSEGEDMLFALLGGQVAVAEVKVNRNSNSPIDRPPSNGPRVPSMNGHPGYQSSHPQNQQSQFENQYIQQHHHHPHQSMNTDQNPSLAYRIPDQLQLPIVHHVPCPIPHDVYPMNAPVIPSQHNNNTLHHQTDGLQNHVNGSEIQDNGELRLEDLDPTQLWARLQTYYEPTPAGWGIDLSLAVGGSGIIGGAGVDAGSMGTGYPGPVGMGFGGAMPMY